MRRIIMSSLDLARIREKIKEVSDKNVYIMREIERLQEELNRARVVKPHQVPSDVIAMHSMVTVAYLSTGKEFAIRLVYPEEANVRKNRVSVFAPVGAALLGYRKGDTIHWNAPGGKIKIKVKDVVSDAMPVGV